MKILIRLIIPSLILTCAVGCIKDGPVQESTYCEVVARMEFEPETKTSLSGLQGRMYYPLWSEGDEIAVYMDGDESPVKFSLTSGGGTTGAVFGSHYYITGSDCYAFYPFDQAGTVSGKEISFTLPKTQKYEAGSFGQGCFPMIARWDNGEFKFKNLCAIMKVSIIGKAVIRSVTLTAKDSTAYLSGPATVSTESVSEPELVLGEGGENSIVLDCRGTELSEDTPTDFHFVLPAQTYKGGFELTVDVYTDTVRKNIDADLIFSRSKIRHLKGMELLAQMPDFNYDDMPLDEVWYRTTDNKPLRPFDAGKALFDRTIISHTYENGFGVIKCDGPITKVNDDAFRVINNSKSENLSELYLPDGITSIGNFAILGNYYLSVLRIPDALKEIGKWGLQRNNNLRQFIGTKVSADGKCVIIDNILYAFAPKDLVSYAVPSGVEELAERAFAFSSIEEISLPDGLKTIGDRAFFDCSELKSITFPESLKIMGSSPFYGCNSLTGFYGNEKFHTSDNRCLINRGADYVELALFAAGSELSVYRIPDGITSLADYSFMDCKSLSKLYFPESVKFVWKNAFMNTANIKELAGPNVFSDKRSLIVDNKLLYVAGDGLTEYITPDHVEIIEEGAFRYNDDIERIVLSDNVKSVGYNCYSYSNYGNVFDQCFNLKEITISANMEELGEDLFSAAPWLTPTVEIVYCRAQVPPNASFYWNNSFEYDELTIYIPKGSLNAYLADAEWAKYSQYLKEYDYQDLPQNDPDLPDDGYVSIDYSQDGTVVAMQKAAEGNGINIVMMGDGYSDRQIADGMYAADMEYAYNNIFTIEPYKSFKDMFNISYVNVVSAAEGFDYGTTALDCGFGEGTRVYGDSGKCLSYAMNVVDEDEVDETLIIVVMNSDKFAGTCYSYYPETNSKDFGSGVAVAYFSKGSDEKKFAQLLHHEACGHGFAKLADEYSGLGTVPGDYAGQIQSQQSDWGWWKNVDFTDDPAQVLWSGFLKDARYANEGLGVFEGGLTYSKGVWRPTETSIMLHNIGGFNAPSREAIYYRIHKLAYGDEWEYDYETFVEWDARNRASVRAETAPQHRGGNYVEKAFEPLAPPVVINRTWKEALNASE